MSQTFHRHSKAWLVLGWGIPIVSLWYPKQFTSSRTCSHGWA